MAKVEMVDGFWPVGTVVELRTTNGEEFMLVAGSQRRTMKPPVNPPDSLWSYPDELAYSQDFWWFEEVETFIKDSDDTICKWELRSVECDPRLMEAV